MCFSVQRTIEESNKLLCHVSQFEFVKQQTSEKTGRPWCCTVIDDKQCVKVNACPSESEYIGFHKSEEKACMISRTTSAHVSKFHFETYREDKHLHILK